MKLKWAFTIVLAMSASSAQASWVLKRIRQGTEITPIGVTEITTIGSSLVPKLIKSVPQFHAEGGLPSESLYEEILWPNEELPPLYAGLAFTRSLENFASGTEVRTIVEQGPARNRICLTVLGDGYTLAEKEKFFEDVARIVDDLFKGKTFQSYTPLFNVYAVFVPSKESGITDLQKKNTAFGLYRSPAGSKRAIMPGNPAALNQAVALAPKTDYPIVLANDDYYGGLGGQFAISTRSIESGRIVLRHELGHNFGNVGEEYDGGSVYAGANSSETADVPWKQWLKQGQTKVMNDMRFLGGAYVWQNLAKGPVTQKFEFPAANSKGPFWFEVQVSSVGWERLDDVQILLDGSPLVVQGKGTADRSFFSTALVQDLKPGTHTLEISEVNHDGNNILAFANLYAYEADYDFTGGIGAFKTYDDGGNVTYRPTHQHCLMRDMLYEFFCSVDQENMWIQFLGRTRLIDDVQVGTSVSVHPMKLSGLSIAWFQQRGNQWTEVPALKNVWTVATSELSKGSYKVKVDYQSPEIRKSASGLSDQANFEVP